MYATLVAALTAVTLALAAGPARPPVKKPAPVQKHKAKARYEWVCKGNSYMLLRPGFNPKVHGCKRVRVSD